MRDFYGFIFEVGQKDDNVSISAVSYTVLNLISLKSYQVRSVTNTWKAVVGWRWDFRHVWTLALRDEH